MDNNIKKEKKSRAGLLGFLLILLLFAATAVVIAREFDITELFTHLRESKYIGFLYAAPALVLIHIGAFGVFMRTAMKELEVKLGRFRAFVYSCVDFFYTSATPGGCGGPAGMAVTMATDGLPASVSSAAVIMQTVFFRFVLLVLGSVSGVMVYTGVIETEPYFRILFIVGGAVSVILALAFVLALFFTPIAKKVGNLFIFIASKLRLVKDRDTTMARFSDSLAEYKNAAVVLKSNRMLMLKLFVITLIQRAGLFAVSYLVYRSFGMNEHGFFYVFFLQVSVAVAVDSLPIPGGIGLNELVFIVLYGRMYPDQNDAAVAMLLTRAFTYYLPLIFTAMVTLLKNLFGKITSRKKKKEA